MGLQAIQIFALDHEPEAQIREHHPQQRSADVVLG